MKRGALERAQARHVTPTGAMPNQATPGTDIPMISEVLSDGIVV